jgi:hypothetical protein
MKNNFDLKKYINNKRLLKENNLGEGTQINIQKMMLGLKKTGFDKELRILSAVSRVLPVVREEFNKQGYTPEEVEMFFREILGDIRARRGNFVMEKDEE